MINGTEFGGGTENSIFGGGMLELKFIVGLTILGGGILKLGGGKLILRSLI